MKPLNILIVDDSATMRQFVRRAVQLSKVPVANVLEAANGQEALAVLDVNQVDALFIDINMPVMSSVGAKPLPVAPRCTWRHFFACRCSFPNASSGWQ